jgi:hypothetical protein
VTNATRGVASAAEPANQKMLPAAVAASAIATSASPTRLFGDCGDGSGCLRVGGSNSVLDDNGASGATVDMMEDSSLEFLSLNFSDYEAKTTRR